jgi:hypothetical protein
VTISPVEYAEKGYAVLPCWWVKDDGVCACGNAACNAVGKHPINSLVPHGVFDASRDPAVVGSWLEKAPAANWGLAMGANGLVAIDIDPRNGGDVTWSVITESCGEPPETWTARTGGGGTHFIMAALAGNKLPGKIGKGIDLKHGNSYVLVEPSKTQGGYFWIDDLCPLEGAPLADFVGFPEAEQAAPAVPSGVVRMVDSSTLADLRAALPWLDADNRETWIKAGHALRQLGPAGFSLWNEWSQLSTKYRADDQAKRWAGFSPDTINLETVFFDAQAAGWPGKPLSQVSQSQPITEEVSAPTARGFDAALPVPMLAEAAAWLGGDAETARAAAISLAGFAASRRYESNEGDPAHLYLMAVSDSVGDLRVTLQQYARLLLEAGLRKCLRESRINTLSQLDRIIKRSPATVWLSDEYATGVAYAARQPAGTLEQALNALSGMYSKRFYLLEASADASAKDEDAGIIYSPALSIFASAAHAHLVALVKSSELARGALEQMMVVNAGKAFVEPDQASAPEWLITHIRLMRGMPENFDEFAAPSTLFNDNSGLPPNMIVVSFQTRPEAHWPAFEALTSHRALWPMLRGAYQNMRRMAVALAAWANPQSPVVTAAILDWCAGYVLCHTREHLATVRMLGSDEGKVSVAQKLLAIIHKSGPAGISRGKLHCYCRAFKQLPVDKRAEIIEQMMEDGDVEEVIIGSRKSKVLVVKCQGRQEDTGRQGASSAQSPAITGVEASGRQEDANA